MFLFVNYCIQDHENCENGAGCFGDKPQSTIALLTASQPTQALSSSLLSLLHCREHDNSFDK